MAKKKKNSLSFGLDLNLFSIVVAGLAVVSLVLFFATDLLAGKINIWDGVSSEWSYSFLDVAIGVKQKVIITIELVKPHFLLWIVMVLLFLIAGVALLVKGKLKNAINAILGLLALIFLIVVICQFVSETGSSDANMFNVTSAFGYISMVLYLGIIGVSGYKAVK